MTTTPNQYEALKAKRNQLRQRMSELKLELNQCALTLRSVESQFNELKPLIAKTSLKTALELAGITRK